MMCIQVKASAAYYAARAEQRAGTDIHGLITRPAALAAFREDELISGTGDIVHRMFGLVVRSPFDSLADPHNESSLSSTEDSSRLHSFIPTLVGIVFAKRFVASWA